MQKLLFLLLFIPFTACTSTNTDSQSKQTEQMAQEPVVKAVNADEFENAMQSEDVIILDVRTDGEVAQGVIPGAIQIDFMDTEGFEKGVAELPKDKEILVYCKVGGRSSKAAEYMAEQGFTKVIDLRGGYMAWTEAGKTTGKLEK